MILAIYGCGGLGSEIFELAKLINRFDNCWDEIVFVADNEPLKEKYGARVINFEEAVEKNKQETIKFVIAVGEPESRKLLYNKVKSAGVGFDILIHPNSRDNIAGSAHIGEGAIIKGNVYISPNVVIGANTLIQSIAIVGHDSKIGSNCVISAFCEVAGWCNIGDCTYIAIHVPVRDRITIGSDVIVGMGSVVLRDLPDNVVAMGNPARPMRPNDDKKIFK